MPVPHRPPSWDRLAKNHIPGRDWETICNVWSAAAIGFDPKSLSDLSQAVAPILAVDFHALPPVSVFEFQGGQVAAFHDAAAAVLKACYVLRSASSSLLSGQPTWAAVDAYHFSFLSCRALLALLGIHFVQVIDTTCVVDVFPRGRLEHVRKQFDRENRGAVSPARVIFQERSRYIEQSAMWAILIRALNSAALPAELERDVRMITTLGDGFGRARNEMLYRNASWIYKDDFMCPNCNITINDDIHTYEDITDFFVDEPDANFAFAAIFARVLFALISNIQDQSGANLLPTSYGPCLAKFPGFGVYQLDRLFASLYRKESYGVDIMQV